MTAPGQTVGVSVFVDPMVADLGVSRSQLSTAYLIGTLTGAAALPAMGTLIDRWGVRRVMTLVATGFGAVLVALSSVGSIVALTVGFVGVRFLGQGSLSLVSTTAVTLWFDRYRGVAIGTSSAAGGALLSLAPLALGVTISEIGWRMAWVVAGLAVWIVVLPIARLGMADSPAAAGQVVDGIVIAEDGAAADRATAADEPERARPDVGTIPLAGGTTATVDDTSGWTRTEALRTAMFWALTSATAANGLIVTALAFHQISLLGERGLTPTQAAANFVPQTVAAIVGTLLMGVLADRIAPRLLMVACMVLLAGAMLLVQVAQPGLLAIAFGVAVGAAGGAVRALEAAVFPRYFGLAHIGGIRGLVLAIGVGATAFGPLALAVGFERAGTYGPILNLLLLLPVAVCVLAVFAPVPNGTLRARIRSAHK